ncbi:enoyl-CoA hydratase/isomerase family protein [Pelagibacterium montanilacus]|uniref:enoyl-CoA hydratase/isomerase family protein n=1 Tax=Pelagibacterium montanilacus TaxID=2185280 RepID=UPI000F8E6028|nr:enoyl-CoA hydratase/isomerase family protein [Pelagibacterium montanilacus]
MSAGAVTLAVDGPVARIVFDRPEARNAMTWEMYEELGAACDTIAANRDIRCAVLRGAGGKAFVAGTDIARFTAFEGAEDGLRYEREMEAILAKLADLSVPTLAVVEGWAVGGGLALSALCDVRIATPEARFGLPIARTLGNCISIANIARLSALLGPARVQRLIVLAEMLTADELHRSGFLAELVAPEALEGRVEEIIGTILSHAPLTMRAIKTGMARLAAPMPEDSDLVALCYGSRDFREGVSAFIGKAKPHWTGE